MVFTPHMIVPVEYDPTNFSPLCIDGVSVPEVLFSLASLSPSFSPTPTRYQPPDGQVLHDEMLEYKRVLSWSYLYRKKEFENAESIEDFVNTTFKTFEKSPWYQKSQRKPPQLPQCLEKAFQEIYSTVMNPQNWFKFQPNLSSDQRQALLLARSLPSQGIGVYLQDKSSRICFASLTT